MSNICEWDCSELLGLRRVLLAAAVSLTDCLVTKVTKSLLGILYQVHKF